MKSHSCFMQVVPHSKLVPCSYTWLNTVISKAGHIGCPKRPGWFDVTVWMGSMCHIGQTFGKCPFNDHSAFGNLQHRSCTVQPTNIAFSSEELVGMVQRCGLNRLNQFATFLIKHLRNSRCKKAAQFASQPQ